jgi:formamidopyrimidine-DNA glycosylase
MPELPEVEAFVRAGRDRVAGRGVESVPVAHFATVKTIDPPVTAMAGHRATDLRRRAKRVLVDVEEVGTLVIHPMSAGRITLGEKRMRSAVLVVALAGGTELGLIEQGKKRRAAAWLLDDAGLDEMFDHTGPEPLDPAFTTEVLRARFAERPGQLHASLRDQRIVAGIGRAYANEILHDAMLPPFGRTATLSDEELARLHGSITGVLGRAVEQLLSYSQDGLAQRSDRVLAVHNRFGQLCPRCGDTLRRVDFEEHTITYCPTCQTGGRVLADRRMSRLLRE